MAGTKSDILAALHKQEAALISELATVRKAIRYVLAKRHRRLKARTHHPQEPNDPDVRFLEGVLAELGPQFSCVDIFEKAKQHNPNLTAAAIRRGVNQLRRTGAIQRVEKGHGWHPPKFRRHQSPPLN